MTKSAQAQGKRPRSHSTTSEVPQQPAAEALRTVYHYPSTQPFPVALSDDFPEETYRSRNGDVKSAIHWGQRKLLLSEIQLLCMYCKPAVSYHIVYAGSAPGTHLAFLDDMFDSRHTWELVDPGQFDRPVLEGRKNFTLRNEFFTNATAYGINARRVKTHTPALAAVYEYLTVDTLAKEKAEIHERLQGMVGTLDVARGTEDIPSMYETPISLPRGFELLAQVAAERERPVLFVSDIRSGSVALSNFEEHVAENMKAQACWTSLLHGDFALLKFRLPYTWTKKKDGDKETVQKSQLIRDDGTVPYLRGDILLPIWTRPTSTEGRLVVPQGAFEVPYDVAKVENQFFFFNSRVREQLHFNHLPVKDEYLDHHYDASAEIHCLERYLQFMKPELKQVSEEEMAAEVKRVADSITTHLGMTFLDAIRKRDVLMVNYAKRQGANPRVEADSDGDKDRQPMSAWEKHTREMNAKAWRDRNRAVWKRNVDETDLHEPSGVWCTTTMNQHPAAPKEYAFDD